MVYNRYIPSADGTYRRQIVHAQTEQAEQVSPVPQQEPITQTPPPRAVGKQSLFPSLSLDRGDLLVLLILLLILTDGEDNDPLTILVTLAAFFILQ